MKLYDHGCVLAVYPISAAYIIQYLLVLPMLKCKTHITFFLLGQQGGASGFTNGTLIFPVDVSTVLPP